MVRMAASRRCPARIDSVLSLLLVFALDPDHIEVSFSEERAVSQRKSGRGE